MVNPGFGLTPLGITDTLVPFTLHVPDTDISQSSSPIQSAVIGAPSFYNTQNATSNPSYDIGVSRDWLANATAAWVHDFDWRAFEARLNALPQFTINVAVPSDGQVFDLHFGALFSPSSSRTAGLARGWITSRCWGSSQRGIPRRRCRTISSPLSIPDYGLSTRSRVAETELGFYAAAEALNELMKALEFTACVAQGGDVGSAVTAALCASYIPHFHDNFRVVISLRSRNRRTFCRISRILWRLSRRVSSFEGTDPSSVFKYGACYFQGRYFFAEFSLLWDTAPSHTKD